MLSSFSISALCIELPPCYIIPGNRVYCSPRRSDFCMSCVLALVLRVFLISCIVVNQSPFPRLLLTRHSIISLLHDYQTLHVIYCCLHVVLRISSSRSLLSIYA